MEQNYKHSDLFLTHTWRNDLHGRDNHARVRVINEELNRLGFSTWFDEKSMSGDIAAKMQEGVDFTKVVVVFVTEQYMLKIDSLGEDNCKYEFDRAATQKTDKNMLCIVMEEKFDNPANWFGKLKETLGGCLYVSMSGNVNDKHYLKEKLQLVVEQLKSKGVAPSQTKNKCEDCTVTNKSGEQQPLFGDGDACTFCGEDMKKLTDPKNYCANCNVHSNGSFCQFCKVNLLDKNQRIYELEQQLLKVISLQLDVDLSKYNVEDFKVEIERMQQELFDISAKRCKVLTPGVQVKINETEYNSKVEQLQKKMNHIFTNTSQLNVTKNEVLQNLEPSYNEELAQLKDTMRSLESRRKDLDQRADQLSRAKDELQQLEKEVAEFADEAVVVEELLHGKDCPCDDCSFERELTSKMITEGPEYLESMVAMNEIEKLKTAINLKSEIRELKDHNELILLLSLTVQYGTVEMLLMLLKEGIYIDIEEMMNLVRIGGCSNLLTKIMSDNDVKSLRKIIELQKGIINAKDRNGFNLLLALTLRYGTVEMLIMLSKEGIHIDITGMTNLVERFGDSNLLRQVISDNEVESLRRIIELQKDIINAKVKNGFSLWLLLTVQYGALEMFKMLVEMGLEADTVNARNENLLHYAKNTDIANVLCVKYGDVLLSVKDEDGFTPFMRAYHENDTTIVETISPFVKVEEEKRNYFTLMFERKNFDYIEELIENNDIVTMTTILTIMPDVVKMEQSGNDYSAFVNYTPFLQCSGYGSIEMLKLLVDKGSDVNKCSGGWWGGDNGLMIAVSRNKTEWCEEVVEYLCNTQRQLLTMENKEGYSVFHMAGYHKREELVPILLKHSPPPQLFEKKNNHGETPIYTAKGSEAIVQMYENYIKHCNANTTTSTE